MGARGTGIGAVAILGIWALIIARVWSDPKGTQAAGNVLITTEKNFGNQVA